MTVVTGEKVDELIASIDALDKKSKRNRRLIVITIVSLIMDVSLTLGLGLAFRRTDDAQQHTQALVEQVQEANSNTAKVQLAIKVACQASNEQSVKQHELWQGLLALPSSTPANPDVVAQFNKLLDDTFPQKDCG